MGRPAGCLQAAAAPRPGERLTTAVGQGQQGRPEVDLSVALSPLVPTAHVRRSRGKDRLDVVGGQRRPSLQELRHQAGHHRGSLRGAAAPEQPVVSPGYLAEHDVDRGARRPKAREVRPRGDQVRVTAAVTASREVGDRVSPATGVRRTDCEHERVAGRVGQAGGTTAVVARRDNHDDARPPGHLRGVGQRVHDVVLPGVGSEGQVQDPDVASAGVGVRHDPVDPGDDLRDVGVAEAVGDLDADNPGGGGDTQQPGGLPTDDPGQVGPVAEAVNVLRAGPRLERQIWAGHDVPGETWDVCDTAVHQRHVHPLAGQPGVDRVHRGTHVVEVLDGGSGASAVRLQADTTVTGDLKDPGVGGPTGGLGRGESHHVCGDEADAPYDGCLGGELPVNIGPGGRCGADDVGLPRPGVRRDPQRCGQGRSGGQDARGQGNQTGQCPTGPGVAGLRGPGVAGLRGPGVAGLSGPGSGGVLTLHGRPSA